VNPNVTPTFSLGSSLTICAGAAVPSLPTLSNNGINGSWSPSTIDNQASGTYTFTAAAGVCATPVVYSVTVNPNVLPTFSFGTALTICAGSAVPALPTNSNNGIAGTWSPATIDNQNPGTYVFTPTAGICATTTSLSVTVTANITPSFSFGTSLSICAGATVPALPSTSNNGISGSWNPAMVNNTASGSYTFTPAAGQCAVVTTFIVTVNPNITPVFSFGNSMTICAGATAPVLPATSTNGINGSWSPAVADNQNSGTYTFTPAAGVCAVPVTFNLVVTPNVTPVFSFGTAMTICANGATPALPANSNNGINGTWNPSTIDNQNTGTYTFIPAPGQCATSTSLSVTITPNVTPTFSIGSSMSICAGGSVPALPPTSANGINGTWSPATVDNQNSATYTFTPSAGQCALTTTFTMTVNPNVTPVFSFGTSLTLCTGAASPSLPTISANGINGSWSPAAIDNNNSGTYTFTPAAGQCAITMILTVTVNPNTIPVFSFGSSLSICAGASVPVLPAISTNGVSGSWSPSTVSNQSSGTYTFTPDGGCASPISFAVTVTPNTVPTFSFGNSLIICNGGSVPSLPTTSVNGVSGTWNPATVDNQASGTYVFTPSGGFCATTASFNVTVNPIVTPAFGFGTSLTLCTGSTAPSLPNMSNNGINGTWTPASIDNQVSGTYTFTPAAGECAITTTLNVTIAQNTVTTFNIGSSLTICAGTSVPSLSGTSDNGIAGSWNPAVINNTASGNYTFTPNAGVCATNATYSVTVNPVVTPSFNFGTALSICEGSTAPSLPAASTNGVTGSWSPATIDNMNSANYSFTPDAGQCATPIILNVTVNTITTPLFSFGSTITICAGSGAPSLPATSGNGVTGTWNPSVPNDQASAVYTFTPASRTVCQFNYPVDQCDPKYNSDIQFWQFANRLRRQFSSCLTGNIFQWHRWQLESFGC
jgi:hypothetical protein